MKLTSYLLSMTLLGSLGSASAILPPPPPSEVDAAMENDTISPPSPVSAFESSPSLMGSPAVLIPPPPPSETENAFESFLKVGYSSNYDYKGMVVSSALCKQGDVSYALGTNYALSNGMILASGIQYTDIYGGALNADNETLFTLGLKDEVLPNLHVQYGYSLTHGGFAGEYARFMGEAHSVTQAFDLSLHYKFGISGYFAGLETSYSFQGLTGWWLGGVFGYEYEVNEKLNLRLTAGTSASWSYWQTSGANQINVRLQADYHLADNWVITPMVSTHWLCNSGLKMNSRAGEHLFRLFTVMAGVQVSYQF